MTVMTETVTVMTETVTVMRETVIVMTGTPTPTLAGNGSDNNYSDSDSDSNDAHSSAGRLVPAMTIAPPSIPRRLCSRPCSPPPASSPPLPLGHLSPSSLSPGSQRGSVGESSSEVYPALGGLLTYLSVYFNICSCKW